MVLSAPGASTMLANKVYATKLSVYVGKWLKRHMSAVHEQLCSDKAEALSRRLLNCSSGMVRLGKLLVAAAKA